MAESPPGSARPPVRVRYYPRRVARRAVSEPLSPGRALHLENDPARAELARQTSEQQLFVEPATPPAPAVFVAGKWRRFWRRLIRSD